MKNADEKDSYINVIADYFCSLAGRVPMISSEDTDILMRWWDEGISSGTVLRGIRKAFEENPSGLSGISGCVSYVEKSTVQNPQSAGGAHKSGVSTDAVGVSAVIECAVRAFELKVQKALESAGEEGVRKCLEKVRARLCEIPTGGIEEFDSFLESLRGGFCSDIHALFDAERKQKIENRLAEIVPASRSFINENERKKIRMACMNDLILETAGLEELFDAETGEL